ncbi:MAG: aminotransferase class V-fold PLP-dependent enzyme, partial [Thermoleophilia bacterium]|nr:aminotransferase class V-fold PLP-dependent enzyme [Thermoleophilia bacterium]
MERHLVYLDHASTTPTDPEVVEAMLPFFSGEFGNPASLYSLGTKAAQAVEEARATIAGFLEAKAEEIYFT